MKSLAWSLLILVLFAGCQPPNASRSAGNSSAGGNRGDSATASGAAKPAASGNRNEEKVVGSVKLKPTRLLDGKFEILLPDDFQPMPDELLRVKYPSQNRPTLVFTNPDGSVNVALNHTSTRVSPAQLEEMHQQLDTSIRQAHPQAEWRFSGFWNHHGRRWTQLEFISQAADTRIHNLMLATSADNRMLAVTFNATDEQSAEWNPVGREIISSVFYED